MDKEDCLNLARYLKDICEFEDNRYGMIERLQLAISKLEIAAGIDYSVGVDELSWIGNKTDCITS